MADQMINLSFSMKEIFDLIPEIASEILKNSSIATEIAEIYKGTEFSFVFEFDDEKYSLVIKDGADFKTGHGDLENPMFRISIPMDDLQQLIVVKNAYMFLGRQGGFSQSDRDRMSSLHAKLSSIQGTVVINLTNDDDSTSTICTVFNNTADPKVAITLAMEDVKGLLTNESNPVNLFMSGRLKLEGDMGLAMSFQTLM